jgi:NTP pyrophosphatase (non-canonical NTP hydrolase)
MTITWDQIDEANVERAHVWHQDSTPWTVDMWLTAFVGELGEFANILKKINRLESNITSRPSEQDMADLLLAAEEEFADMTLYFFLLMYHFELKMDQHPNVYGDVKLATIRKFNKTSKEMGFDITLPESIIDSIPIPTFENPDGTLSHHWGNTWKDTPNDTPPATDDQFALSDPEAPSVLE